MRFEWDPWKNAFNVHKHGVPFGLAQHAFEDPKHIVIQDIEHSAIEPRYFCFGLVTREVLTVRFTLRGDVIRIFGAGYWRFGRAYYEKENRIH